MARDLTTPESAVEALTVAFESGWQTGVSSALSEAMGLGLSRPKLDAFRAAVLATKPQREGVRHGSR
jgi:hypothetical protein